MVKNLEKYFNNKKVLITGHTGFKGSWLSIWLKMLGAEVIGLGLDPKTNNDNFVLSGVKKLVKDYRCDIRNKEEVLKIFKKEKPEIIFHLAAQPLVIDSYKDPITTFETNIMGTANILEAIRYTDSVRVAIMITTDKVYENMEWVWPYREDDRLGGYDPYSSSKAAAELIIASYRNSFFNPVKYNQHRKAIASVRAGNVIGGGDWAENRIVPDCIRHLQNNKKIEVRVPEAMRPWQYVLEPLSGYLLLGVKMLEYPERYATSWNFGPEASNIINVKNLVSKIIKYYGKGQWCDISNKSGVHEAKLLSLDINKAKYLLGWKPLLSFDETVRLTVDWYLSFENDNKITEKQINFFQNKMDSMYDM